MNTGLKHFTSAVPVFSLYGEPETEADPASRLEFVHIESIAARSQRYDWEIDPHAHHGLCQLLFLFGGGARVAIDGASLVMNPPAAIVIPPSVVHAFRFLPGTEGSVLTFADSLLTGRDAGEANLFEPFNSGPRLLDLGADDGVPQRLAALLEQISDEFRWPQSGRDQMFEWLVRAVLLLVARKLSVAPLSGNARWRADLFARFRRLVQAHFAEHWSVQRYADALSITESRLNRLCQSQTGKSAFDIIQDRLLLEARRKLFYIAATVTQVAYELGFADPAYFCRFFKKHTGVAPSAFRRERADS